MIPELEHYSSTTIDCSMFGTERLISIQTSQEDSEVMVIVSIEFLGTPMSTKVSVHDPESADTKLQMSLKKHPQITCICCELLRVIP